MKKSVLVFGLIGGVIVSSVMAVSMAVYSAYPEMKLGNGSMMIGYLSMLVAFSMIYVAIKNYRDKQNAGMIGFGKAFRMGFFISLIASTMYVIAWAVIYHFLMPDFMDLYIDNMIKQAAATATPSELKLKMEEMEKYKEMYKSPLFFTLMTYAEILPVGLLVTLISAAILKRKEIVIASD